MPTHPKHPEAVPTAGGFAAFKLAQPVLQSIQELGYEIPYPIQEAAIPALLDGRDLLGQAQTGTGKTAAFALPILTRLNLGLKEPQALVLTPTRELAIQVAEAMHTYARHLPGFHVLPVYGGQPIDAQLHKLRRGVHVVVGTPGRLLDHLRRQTLRLESLQTVVIDEADEMLRMGFIDEVQAILDQTPPGKQVALFSATFPQAITRIARRHLRDPFEVRIASPTTTVATTTQRYWQVSGTHKLDALTRLLETEDFDAMLVFVRTRVATEELAEKLEARGYSCAALSGELSQAQREKTIDRLRRGTLDIVVATDVAARGLDVDRVSHVINYDIPVDAEAYVHRIGRTGRAGRKGSAILFVAPREGHMLGVIERATRQPLTRMSLPSREDITDRRVARFKERLSETIESHDLTFFKEIVLGYQSEHGADLDEIAAALACLAQEERPLQQKPEAGRPDTRPARTKPGTKAADPHRHPHAGTRSAAAASASASDGAGAPVHSKPQRAGRTEPVRHEGPPPTGSEPTAEAKSTPRERPDPKKRRMSPAPAPGKERYRLEVGSAHGVEVRNIVGALANEADLESRFIGPVEVHDTYTIVDLPEGMPSALCKHLRNVWVGGRQLKLRLASAADRPGGGSAPGPALPGDWKKVKLRGHPSSKPRKKS